MTKDSNGVHFCMCASVFLMRACIPHDNGAALGIIGCAELRLRRQRERERDQHQRHDTQRKYERTRADC